MDASRKSSPSRVKQRLLPFGALRVRLRFAGVEVCAHEKNPWDLIGRVYPWDSLGPFGTWTRLIDGRGQPVRCEGRRLFVKLDDTRVMRAAARLRARWIVQRLRTAENVRAEYRPERYMRWIFWLLPTALAVAFAWMFVPPLFNGQMSWLHLVPASVRNITITTFAFVFLFVGCKLGFMYYLGWKLSQHVAVRINYDSAGFRARISNGDDRQVDWSAVRTIRHEWSGFRLDIAGQESIRFALTPTTRTVLKWATDHRLPNDPKRTQPIEEVRGGLTRRLLWRSTAWWMLGGALAALAMWWIHAQGLARAPLTAGQIAAGISTYAFMPTLMWVAWHFGGRWSRCGRRIERKLFRLWRRIWPLRT